MQGLVVHHGPGHPSGDLSDGSLALPCRHGELVALVDAGANEDLGFDVTGRGDPVLVLDERVGAPRRATLRPLGGRTTVLVTRRIDGLADIVDRIVVVYAGHVIESGTAAQVIHNPRHPLTRRLLRGGRSPVEPVGAHDGCPYVVHCPLGDSVCVDHVPGLRTVADRQVACHYAEL